MNPSDLARLRAGIARILASRGHSAPVADDTSLFASGLLESLAATEVIVLLEAEFGCDLSDADFDVGELDSLTSLARLIERQGR